ncbi:F-box/WD repeat-containing protein lin-23 [Cytospora mali]|uniref:F-box/WD repeat-containing protein lin-23 n=1 Tax=Cytospora mali TaxID=578113 RepID=A0A194WD04_CYTMA|nr:F-box/WD repeat-containing protein lin-23 [Valsa mali]
METYGVSQQTDEGYSEHPLNPPSPAPPSFSFKEKYVDSGSTSSPAHIKEWLSAHIASLPTDLRTQLTLELLDNLPTSLVAEIVEKMNPRLYIDFIRYLPAEICLKILGYLDPISLLSVAQTCRSWYGLAVDRTLWQSLYHMEGWKVVASELEAAEELVNRRSAPGSMHRQKSEEDGHTHKKRAVSLEDDQDHFMMDAGHPLTEEPKTLDGDESLFGGVPSRSNMTPDFSHLNMQASYSSAGSFATKGKGVDKGKGKAVTRAPTDTYSSSPGTSKLWIYDPSSGKYKVNWQYLYAMRRKLEINWEQGNFKNFQLPHPDHMDEGHNNECIYSIQFNEEYLVSGSRDRTLRIWNLATRRLVRKPLVGHIGSVLCLQFDSDPDEDIIVSGSSDSDVIVWRFSTGEIIQRLTHAHRESVLNVKFDKRILATCSKDKTIKIFNRRALKAGDPGYVMVNPVPTTVKRYGYEDSPLDQLPIIPPFTMIGILEGHSAAVNAVQIVDDEVVSASGDRQIKVWDWQTGACKRTFVGHNKGIACVQYDGKRIVSGSSDNEVKVFCRETGIEVASLRDHQELVRTVQAGFGDLPWSTEEDAAEAKRVDLAYMKAVEGGEVSTSPRRGRPGNAGSTDPEEITAYGAKLPPGGGGGRRWGRIVSGSYDKTIIIWRRDKTGKWKPQHKLKQEEAAARAQQSHPRPPPGPPGHGHGHAPAAGGSGPNGGSSLSQRGQHPPPEQTPIPGGRMRSARSTAARSTASSSMVANPSTSSAASGPSATGSSSRAQLDPRSPAQSGTSASRPRFSHPLIPQNVPAVPADQITHRSYAQLIDLIVPQGVHALQQALSNYPTMLTLQSHLKAAIEREASPFVRSQLRQVVSAATVRTQVAQARARQQGFAALQAADVAAINGSDDDAGVGSSNAGAGGSAPAPAAAAVSNVTGGPPPAAGTGGQHRLQPHGTPEVGVPTRIYKLQFDARRIICCSQTSIIVGWDFCNGDPAMEEVARFFATVE